MGIDYVDLLALHEPTPEECADPEIIITLKNMVEKGYARAISIAGSVESIIRGASATDLFQACQFSDQSLSALIQVVERDTKFTPSA